MSYKNDFAFLAAGMNNSIKNAVQTVRRNQGVSASKVADLVGVARQTIYAIEARKYVPNTAFALRLAEVLDTMVEQLFWLGSGNATVGHSAADKRRRIVQARRIRRP